jgi:hypothetical protein
MLQQHTSISLLNIMALFWFGRKVSLVVGESTAKVKLTEQHANFTDNFRLSSLLGHHLWYRHLPEKYLAGKDHKIQFLSLQSVSSDSIQRPFQDASPNANICTNPFSYQHCGNTPALEESNSHGNTPRKSKRKQLYFLPRPYFPCFVLL